MSKITIEKRQKSPKATKYMMWVGDGYLLLSYPELLQLRDEINKHIK